MRLWGSRLKLFFGAWVIAGLFFIGVNGYALLSLLDEPLAGYSAGAHQARLGFERYRRLVSAETEKISSGMELLAQRFAAPTPPPEPPAAKVADPVSVKKKKNPPVVTLPVLLGIVTSQSPTGRSRQMALVDSGVYAEGEILQTFTIRKISAEGVLLAKGKKTWFIKRPDVAYSLSQH